ncbi:MAG: tyrosine-protein phosphatase [Bacteroidales bacterium]|nr:tyrosine-protein phosphatase [Bacteroidales bacterium]
MKLIFSIFFLLITFTITIAQNRNAAWAQKVNANSFTNLFKINDSLYRSEQPDSLDIDFLKQMGIKSILNFRKFHNDIDFLRSQDFNLYEIEMNAYCIKDKDVIAALKILKIAPKPLLFHCKHGSDRTGLIAAMYRIIFQGWTKEQALEELKQGNYGFHHIFINIPSYIRNVDVESIIKQID